MFFMVTVCALTVVSALILKRRIPAEELFMFDDEDYETLAILPDHFENLVTEIKTGFNPFFIPPVREGQVGAESESESLNE